MGRHERRTDLAKARHAVPASKTPPSPADGFESIVAEAIKSTVAIGTEVAEPDGSVRRQIVGSGVVVAAGVVLTCRHVLLVQEAPEHTSYAVIPDVIYDPVTNQSPSRSAKVRRVSAELDLAILEVDGLVSTPAVCRVPCNARRGERVFWLGHPGLDLPPVVSGGLLGSIEPLPKYPGGPTTNVLGYRLDGTSRQGNSGGGLFDAAGRLIGIINAGPHLVDPAILRQLNAAHTGGGALLGDVDVVAVLKTILNDMGGKSLGGTAYAISGERVADFLKADLG